MKDYEHAEPHGEYEPAEELKDYDHDEQYEEYNHDEELEEYEHEGDKHAEQHGEDERDEQHAEEYCDYYENTYDEPDFGQCTIECGLCGLNAFIPTLIKYTGCEKYHGHRNYFNAFEVSCYKCYREGLKGDLPSNSNYYEKKVAMYGVSCDDLVWTR